MISPIGPMGGGSWASVSGAGGINSANQSISSPTTDLSQSTSTTGSATISSSQLLDLQAGAGQLIQNAFGANQQQDEMLRMIIALMILLALLQQGGQSEEQRIQLDKALEQLGSSTTGIQSGMDQGFVSIQMQQTSMTVVGTGSLAGIESLSQQLGASLDTTA